MTKWMHQLCCLVGGHYSIARFNQDLHAIDAEEKGARHDGHAPTARSDSKFERSVRDDARRACSYAYVYETLAKAASVAELAT